MNEEVTAELNRLADNCGRKRKGLLEIARSASRTRKRLEILAGVLALFSGVVVTALDDVLGATATKLLAAATAFAAGVISLLLSFGLKDGDQVNLFDGAAKYLALQNRAGGLKLNAALSDKELREALDELRTAYADLDGRYVRYLVDYGDGPLSSSGPRAGGG